jgi:YHS domain-containing protein
VFGRVQLDYKLALNVVATVIFVALWWLTVRRGVTDPVCGMKVDRTKALTAEHSGGTFHLCSPACRDRFEGDPERYAGGTGVPSEARVATHGG